MLAPEKNYCFPIQSDSPKRRFFVLFCNTQTKERARSSKTARSNAGSFRVSLDDYKKVSALKNPKTDKAIFACNIRWNIQVQKESVKTCDRIVHLDTTQMNKK